MSGFWLTENVVHFKSEDGVRDENGKRVSPLDDDYEYYKSQALSPLDDDYNKYDNE